MTTSGPRDGGEPGDPAHPPREPERAWTPELEPSPLPRRDVLRDPAPWAAPLVEVPPPGAPGSAPVPSRVAWTLDEAAAASPARAAVPVEPAVAGSPPGRSSLGWFRDNLEAFAFAILLALLLRHLCVEVFKIPTSSMEPTLNGDNSSRYPNTAGDRIIVEKTAYVLQAPKRWDVVVFRYPLDWTRNFIKRLAGLSGESLRIVRGDLWVAPTPSDERAPDYHPARKPKTVRDQLYVTVYPPRDRGSERPPGWWWRDETPTANGWTPLSAFGEASFPGDRDVRKDVPVLPAALRYGYVIREGSATAADPSAANGLATPDVRVRGSVVTHGASELALEWRPGDGRVHTLRLAAASRGGSRVSTAARSVTAPALAESGTTTFELESVDGDLRAAIDGEEVAVIPDEVTLEVAQRAIEPSDPQSLTFFASGAPLELRGVSVAHDLYYVSEGRPESGDAWRIPADSYFMLGDNTRNSNDSRRWSASGVRLAEGSEIWFDPSPTADEEPRYPRYETVDGVSYEERRDTEGIVRRWSPGDLMPGSGSLSRRMPFVERERIVGRAWFAVYADVDVWPLKIPRISTSGRIRFIH